jgi:rhodanese-related sulfurtransferase
MIPPLALAALLAALPSPAGPPAPASPPPPGVVDGATAQALAAAGARLVDVRTPGEYATGHLPGAVNVPYDQVAARLDELGPRDGAIVLYCRSGRRTGIAAATLQQLGFTRVYDLQGMTNWPGDTGSAGR